MKSDAPHTKGNIEISIAPDDVFGQGVFIGGDPEGLHSLAALSLWLAELDQDTALELSDEIREHIHLRPSIELSCNSAPAEICRLDAKGAGAFQGITFRIVVEAKEHTKSDQQAAEQCDTPDPLQLRSLVPRSDPLQRVS